MATNKITITGKLGPGISVTSLVFSDVTDVDFQVERGNLAVNYRVNNDIKIQNFELVGITTVTYTISSGIATIVVS